VLAEVDKEIKNQFIIQSPRYRFTRYITCRSVDNCCSIYYWSKARGTLS